jgi:hypothetical protein
MQTNRHAFLNSHGSLNHTLVENTARDVRTEAIRNFFTSAKDWLGAFVARFDSHAGRALHAS